MSQETVGFVLGRLLRKGNLCFGESHVSGMDQLCHRW